MAEPRNIMIPGWLLVDRSITASAKLVYGKIVDRIGKNPSSWPGAGSLAHDLGLGVATVKRSVDELVRAGLLLRYSRGRGRSNSYRVAQNQAQNEPPTSIILIPDQYHFDTQNVIQECIPGKKNTGAVHAATADALPGLTDATKPSIPIKRGRGKRPAPTCPGFRELTGYFSESWKKQFGNRYPHGGAKDAQAVKAILSAIDFDLDKARAIVDAFLTDPDKWLTGKRTLPILRMQLAKYLEKKTNGPAITKPDLRSNDRYKALMRT